MRHTTLTGWIEAADARQVCLGAVPTQPQVRSKLSNKHRRAVRNGVRAVVMSIPLALAIIGATAVASTISHSTVRLDCAGFPAIACHPTPIHSLSPSS